MPSVRRLFLRLLAPFRSRHAEHELNREIASHLALLEEKYLAGGMSPTEARNAALRAFGGVAQVQEHQREARSFRGIENWWLDLKLGGRMLVKSPGLTIVGGLGMAIGIAIGAVVYEGFNSYLDPDTLPLDRGDELVGVEMWDSANNNQERRLLHEFSAWKQELTQLRDLAAWRTLTRNLLVPGGVAEPVGFAEMTASGFTAARVPPLLGRTLQPADEQPNAEPVIVLSYEAWQRHFAGDYKAIGQQVRLGETAHTVIGVMPKGFAFPVNQRLWTALRADPLVFARRDGPFLNLVARLGSGATRESAQAELTDFGRRLADAFPETHQHLRPRVTRYGAVIFDDLSQGQAMAAQSVLVLLLLVVSANVAILVYARTARRAGEIAIRTALGASRGRIVAQHFMEAVALAGAAAVVGLVLAQIALSQISSFVDAPPFWIDFKISLGTVGACAAAVLGCAAVIGVIPALQATGRGMPSALQRIAVDRNGMRLGKTWTALVITQIAISVALLPLALDHGANAVKQVLAEPGFAAERYLTARLVLDRETVPAEKAKAYEAAFAAKRMTVIRDVVQRIEAAPGVSGVTVALHTPGYEPNVWIEVEGVPSPLARGPDEPPAGMFGHRVRFTRTDIGFFNTFSVPLLSGRFFSNADLEPSSPSVIVNRSFAQQIVGEGNALGRRIRYVEGHRAGGRVRLPDGVVPGTWFEIVGVVSDFPNEIDKQLTNAKLYHPMRPGEFGVAHLAIRLDSDPMVFVGQLRNITADIAPNLRLHDTITLDQALRKEQGAMRLVLLVIVIVTASLLLLTGAGIYAMMSFTVAQRRREIGIRTALGANARQLLTGIFARAARQIAIGVSIGIIVTVAIDAADGGDLLGERRAIILLTVAAISALVAALSTIGPARRGLAIQPSEAIRDE
jgi:putative ABC transport system permease protein